MRHKIRWIQERRLTTIANCRQAGPAPASDEIPREISSYRSSNLCHSKQTIKDSKPRSFSSKAPKEKNETRSEAEPRDDKKSAHKWHVHHSRAQDCGTDIDLSVDHHENSQGIWDEELFLVPPTTSVSRKRSTAEYSAWRIIFLIFIISSLRASVYMPSLCRCRCRRKYSISSTFSIFSGFIPHSNWKVIQMGYMREPPLYITLSHAVRSGGSAQGGHRSQIDVTLASKGGHSNFLLWGCP